MPNLRLNRLSIVTRPLLDNLGRAFISEVQQSFPDLETEYILLGQNSVVPTGVAIAFLFDADFATDTSAMKALVEVHAKCNSQLIMPISVAGESCVPPSPINLRKAYAWPEDGELIQTSIGAELGLAIRKGKQRLFISYRTKDGKLAAEAIHSHLSSSGFNVWLDSSRDRYDIEALPIGVDVQQTIESNISESDAVILIDTPLAKDSKWVQLEIEYALGMAVPIISIVIHDPSVTTSLCRFRVLQELQRRVCVLSDQKQDSQLIISKSDLADIETGIDDLLKVAYRCRVLQTKRLQQTFEQNQWVFRRNEIVKQIHEAIRTKATGQVNAIATYCSHEEPVFSATVRSYAKWIAQISQADKHFIQHLYFYPGEVMNDKDIEHLATNEASIANANIGFLHYEEAVAMVNRITGGIHAIFG